MRIKKLSLSDSYEKLKNTSLPKVKTGFELFDNLTGGIGGGESYVINGEDVSNNIKFIMSLLISMAENNPNKNFLYIGNKISSEILLNAYLAHRNNIPDYKLITDESKYLLYKSMDIRKVYDDIKNIWYIHPSKLNSKYTDAIIETIECDNISYVFIEDGSNINFKNEEDPIYKLLASTVYNKPVSFIISNLDLSLSEYKNYDGIFDLIKCVFNLKGKNFNDNRYFLRIKILNNIYEPDLFNRYNIFFEPISTTYNNYFEFNRSTYTFEKGENKNE